GGVVPALDVDVPGERREGGYWGERVYLFGEGAGLHGDFQWLRTPEPERILSVGDGGLELIGRESVGSWFEQALVARRQVHFSYDAETVLEYSPQDERQFAGLVAYYCRYNFFYLAVTADADGRREISIVRSEASYPEGKLEMATTPEPVRIPKEGKVRLKLSIRGGLTLQFWYALEGQELREIGPVLDASLLSDECGGHQAHGSFTGAFVGMACSDLNGTALRARFGSFVYRPVRDAADRYEG
ncbi:concanavalin A-like lectin/glucanase domain-containing protein, partial [Aspergillus varians]